MPIGIGVNAWVWQSPFTTEHLGLLDKAKEIGFDSFEIGLEDPAAIDPKKLRDKFKSTGLRPIICGAFGPSRDLTHEEPRYRQESLDYMAAATSLCETIGAKHFIGPMYSAVGKRRQAPPDQKKREWDLAVSGLRKAARLAADRGVRLAIEPLNRFETDLINTCEQVCRLVKDIGEKNVGVHLDSFHMNIEEKNSYEAIKLAGKNLFHFHACENDRGAPGSGINIDWDGVAKGLKEIGYEGDAVIESFTPQCLSIAAAAAIWRPLARSQDELARDGHTFLRKTLR